MVKSKIYKESVTLNKRKRGIIRKAIELSSICNQQIYIAMYDPSRNTLVEYKSSGNFNTSSVKKFEIYDNGDYKALENKHLTSKQIKEIQKNK